MPNREYICDACNNSFEVYQPLHEELLKKCPKCKKLKLYQNLRGINFHNKEPKTLGQLADLNTKKMGVYGLQERERLEKEKQNNIDREKARKATELTGLEHIAKCDLPKSPIKSLDKETEKKIFSGTPKEQKKKAQKYIKEGKV